MSYPFSYVGSGIAAARKTMSCFVCFKKGVPAAARKTLVKGVPAPLAGYFDWKERTLWFGNDDDSLQWVVRAAYDHVQDDGDEHEPDLELPSAAMWKAFNAELDTWLLGVHAKHPIAVVVKPIDEEYSTETDSWHEWSCERIPTEVLPVVTKVEPRTAAYVARMWNAWMRQQQLERQQALVAALPAAAKAALAKHDALDALIEPTAAPPAPTLPTLEQTEQIWRDLAKKAGPLRLEDAFTAAMIERSFDRAHSPTEHARELVKARRWGDVIDLSSAVLGSGAEFPSNWLPTLADGLIELGRLHEAELVVRKMVGLLESYKPVMIAVAMRYHAARGERDVEAMLYHAGMEWFTTFTYQVPKAEAKQYGSRPEDLPQQFVGWLERWIGETEFVPAHQAQLGHWLVWFDTIGKQHAAQHVAAFEAERDRRNAIYGELAKAPDEVSARTLVDQLAPTVTSDSASRASHTIRERAPLAAYELLERGIANDRREGFRYPTGERVGAIVCIADLALDEAALADRLAHVYELARGYVLVGNPTLHFNLACMACRLGKRTEALGHIARSLALGFSEPANIHGETDLSSLAGDPVFEKLFVDDAARRAAEVKTETSRNTSQRKATKKVAPKKKTNRAKPTKNATSTAKPTKKPKAKPKSKPR